MTPLTHAAVGTVIFQKLRPRRLGPLGWLLAFLLAFVSHYLLDAIPHFETIGPIREYWGGGLVLVVLGVVGVGLSLWLLRRNREAGWIWLILSLWVALGRPSHPWLWLATAVLGLALLAWKTRRAEVVGCLAAGMLAVSADLALSAIRAFERLHHVFHYRLDWGSRIYLAIVGGPRPAPWQARLQDPYFLLGYAAELVVEGFIFFGALYLFSRHRLAWAGLAQPSADASTPCALGSSSTSNNSSIGRDQLDTP
ncbi:MAG: hypothetical protein HY647_03890 [Acidobacteria bacterium]|nr:hypothetical protein [Acidobacteriota bacterium]